MLEADLAFGPSIVANWSNTLADTLNALEHDVVAVEARPRTFAQGYANGHRKVILTVPQAAQYLGLAPKTLRGLARRGVIPAARVGKHWRFVREQLDTHIAAKALENLRPCPSINVPAPVLADTVQDRWAQG